MAKACGPQWMTQITLTDARRGLGAGISAGFMKRVASTFSGIPTGQFVPGDLPLQSMWALRLNLSAREAA